MTIGLAVLVQVTPSGEDCHWKVIPELKVYPVSVNVNEVEAEPIDGLTVAVPVAGVPVQALPIIEVAVLEQPVDDSVPVTVYCSVTVGVATVLAPVVADNVPSLGAQV